LVKGFKDETGKFRPTDRKISVSHASSKIHDASQVMGQNGLSITKQLLKQAGSFAKKRGRQFEQKRQEIQEKQARELKIRKESEKAIISSFKRARDLQIKDPVALKNQILIDVPAIEDKPENLRFVEKIINGFIKREKKKDKLVKKAKTPEDAQRIEDAFEKAEEFQEKQVAGELKRIIAREEGEIKKLSNKELQKLKEKDKESKKDIERLEKENEQLKRIETDLQEKEERTEKLKQKTEDARREKVDKEKVFTFADTPEAKSSAKEDKEEAFDDFLKSQQDTIKQQREEESVKEDAEIQRDVSETLTEKLDKNPFEEDSGFPTGIV